MNILRSKTIWKWAALIANILFWVVFSAWSYIVAENCLVIVLMYYTPLGWIYVGIEVFSVAVLIAAAGRQGIRKSVYFLLACHGMIFVIGLEASVFVAYVGGEGSNCL